MTFKVKDGLQVGTQNLIDSSGNITTTGGIHINALNDIASDSSGVAAGRLVIGQTSGYHGVFDGNEWQVKNNETTVGRMGLNPLGGNVAIGADAGTSTTDQLRVYYNTASTSTSTGALVVDGGVGIGGALNVGTGGSTFEHGVNVISSTGNAFFGLGRIDGTASTPYINFNSGSTLINYDARIIADNGNGIVGGAGLTLYGGHLKHISAQSTTNTITTTESFTLRSSGTPGNGLGARTSWLIATAANTSGVESALFESQMMDGTSGQEYTNVYICNKIKGNIVRGISLRENGITIGNSSSTNNNVGLRVVTNVQSSTDSSQYGLVLESPNYSSTATDGVSIYGMQGLYAGCTNFISIGFRSMWEANPIVTGDTNSTVTGAFSYTANAPTSGWGYIFENYYGYQVSNSHTARTTHGVFINLSSNGAPHTAVTISTIQQTLATAPNHILTIVTTAAHGLSVNEEITISGITTTNFKKFNVSGVSVASVPNSTTFTVNCSIITANVAATAISGGTVQRNAVYSIYTGNAPSVLQGTVYGSTAASGNLTLRSSLDNTKGYVLIDEATASSSSTTGALVVSGGVGIGGNINLAGNLTVGGNTTLGNASTDTVTFTAQIDGNITYTKTATSLIVAQSDTAGGALTITAGHAVTTHGTTAYAGGAFNFDSGNGSALTASTTNTTLTAGAGGAIDFDSGIGGACTGTVTGATSGRNTGGASGTFNLTTGVGGAASGHNFANLGGAAGGITIDGGVGGAGTGGSSTITGGAGGAVAITGGTGGTATGVGSVGAATSGAGGAITITAGSGGAATTGATNVSGAGGNVTITAGSANGTAGITSGTAGTITITGGVAMGSSAGGAVTITAGAARSTGTGHGGALTLKSGNASTTAGAYNAGTVTLDTGTKASSGTGSILIGNTNATSITFGNSNSKTILSGKFDLGGFNDAWATLGANQAAFNAGILVDGAASTFNNGTAIGARSLGTGFSEVYLAQSDGTSVIAGWDRLSSTNGSLWVRSNSVDMTGNDYAIGLSSISTTPSGYTISSNNSAYNKPTSISSSTATGSISISAYAAVNISSTSTSINLGSYAGSYQVLLGLQRNWSAITGTRYGIYNLSYYDGVGSGTAGSRTVYTQYNLAEFNGQTASSTYSSTNIALSATAKTSVAGGDSATGIHSLRGFTSDVLHQSDDATYKNLASMHAYYGNTSITGDTAFCTDAYGIWQRVGTAGTRTVATNCITNAYGVKVSLETDTAYSNIQTGYMFYGSATYVANSSIGTLYGIYIASTNSPSNVLGGYLYGGTLTGDIASNPAYFATIANGTTRYGIVVKNSSTTMTTFIKFLNSTNGDAGAITQNASAPTVTYGTGSDYRLKNNVVEMDGQTAIERINALRPVNFDWYTGEKGQGFIAHEFQEIFPEGVAGVKDGVNEDGSIATQTVDSSFAVATIVAALKEQQRTINQLKSRIVELESK